MIFYNIYAKANVPHNILLKAFPTMFTSLTLDYNYSNISINIVIMFEEVCDLIPTYFEEVEYKRSVLSQ